MLKKLCFVSASAGLACKPALACLPLCLHKALNGKLKIVRLQKNIGSCLAERFFPEHFEDEFVDILVSVVKPEFAFFQMEVKSVFCQPSKAHKARLGEGPEAFNAINM